MRAWSCLARSAAGWVGLPGMDGMPQLAAPAWRRSSAPPAAIAAKGTLQLVALQAGRTSLEAVLSHMAPSDEEMKTGALVGP